MPNAKGELLEADVRDPSVRYAKRKGVLHKRMHFGYGAARGWPDDFFADNGRSLWIEFKRPGATATELQLKIHAEMRAAGLTVYVVDDPEWFKRLLSYIFDIQP